MDTTEKEYLQPLPYPNEMINKWGDYFYPDGPEDAAWFATEHEAHPTTPETLPWPEAITVRQTP